MIFIRSLQLFGLLLAMVFALWTSCAYSQDMEPNQATFNNTSNKDPFEKFNRAMFEFNDTLDENIFKPVAKGYKAVVPEPVRNCVRNVFSNVADVWIAVNNLLQGKPIAAISDVCRVVVNTTIGLLGCLDVASEFGLTKHNEDLGQTLGRWGIGSGPYLVLPFFGPSTFRDGVGLVGDFKADLVANIDHVPTRNTLLTLRFVDRRATLLSVSDVLEKVALDRYIYIRDAYLQRRHSQIYDGNPPDEPNSTSKISATQNITVMLSEIKEADALAKPIGWFSAPNQREPNQREMRPQIKYQ